MKGLYHPHLRGCVGIGGVWYAVVICGRWFGLFLIANHLDVKEQIDRMFDSLYVIICLKMHLLYLNFGCNFPEICGPLKMSK
jgi:hypothetical protein